MEYLYKAHRQSLFFSLLLFVTLLPSPSMGGRPGHAHLNVDPVAHVRTDPTQSVTMLGRHSFNATVGQEHVDNWIVLFCVDWLEHCQGLWHSYRRTATYWEHSLASNASSWRSTAVRFAEVDCAADKPLCNENNVENYPSVLHFKNGKITKAWQISRDAESLSADISKWIGKELTPKIMREEAPRKGMVVESQKQLFVTSVREFLALLSSQEPATAVAGYGILAAAAAVLVWVVGTGLELDFKAIVASFARMPPNAAALLPELKEVGASRTILRSTMEL